MSAALPHSQHSDETGAPPMQYQPPRAAHSTHEVPLPAPAAHSPANAFHPPHNALTDPEAAKKARRAAAENRKGEDEARAHAREQRERDRLDATEEARRVDAERLDGKAAKYVRAFAIACFVVAMPLQIRAFWDPDRWWNLAAPLVLESAAWVALELVRAAIMGRRRAWHFLVLVGLFAGIAAGVNIYDGAAHADIGLTFGLVGGLCSLAGPGVTAVWEFGQRAKGAKATRNERKIAEAQARKAEAERRKKLDEIEARRKEAADRRAATKATAEATKKAEQDRKDAQDEQRRKLYPEAWARYEEILAAHPLGSISRDRAWTDARRAAEHPEVWRRFELLLTAAPPNLKAAELWPVAWRGVHGLPIPQTQETLAADLEQRRAVEELLDEAGVSPERLAVDLLIDDLFGDDGEGGGKAGRKGAGGPSGGPTTRGRKGKRGSSKAPDKPITEAELVKARAVADELGDAAQVSPAALRKAGCGGSQAHLMKVRDAVKRERGIPVDDESEGS